MSSIFLVWSSYTIEIYLSEVEDSRPGDTSSASVKNSELLWDKSATAV